MIGRDGPPHVVGHPGGGGCCASSPARGGFRGRRAARGLSRCLRCVLRARFLRAQFPGGRFLGTRFPWAGRVRPWGEGRIFPKLFFQCVDPRAVARGGGEGGEGGFACRGEQRPGRLGLPQVEQLLPFLQRVGHIAVAGHNTPGRMNLQQVEVHQAQPQLVSGEGPAGRLEAVGFPVPPPGPQQFFQRLAGDHFANRRLNQAPQNGDWVGALSGVFPQVGDLPLGLGGQFNQQFIPRQQERLVGQHEIALVLMRRLPLDGSAVFARGGDGAGSRAKAKRQRLQPLGPLAAQCFEGGWPAPPEAGTQSLVVAPQPLHQGPLVGLQQHHVAGQPPGGQQAARQGEQLAAVPQQPKDPLRWGHPLGQPAREGLAGGGEPRPGRGGLPFEPQQPEGVQHDRKRTGLVHHRTGHGREPAPRREQHPQGVEPEAKPGDAAADVGDQGPRQPEQAGQCREGIAQQDHIARLGSEIGTGLGDRHPHGRRLEGERVVDSISHHRHPPPGRLPLLDERRLVLRQQARLPGVEPGQPAGQFLRRPGPIARQQHDLANSPLADSPKHLAGVVARGVGHPHAAQPLAPQQVPRIELDGWQSFTRPRAKLTRRGPKRGRHRPTRPAGPTCSTGLTCSTGNHAPRHRQLHGRFPPGLERRRFPLLRSRWFDPAAAQPSPVAQQQPRFERPAFGNLASASVVCRSPDGGWARGPRRVLHRALPQNLRFLRIPRCRPGSQRLCFRGRQPDGDPQSWCFIRLQQGGQHRAGPVGVRQQQPRDRVLAGPCRTGGQAVELPLG